MKFSAAATALAIAASVAEAAPAAGKPVVYGVGYDALKGSTPGLLTDGGIPIAHEFRGLAYGLGDASDWSVVKLGGELLPALRPASPPNVLASKAGEPGTRAGRILKANNSDQWNFNELFVACVVDTLGESVPVPCTVSLDIRDYSPSGSAQEEIKFDGGNHMQKAILSLKDIKSVGFVISTAQDLNAPTVLLLDGLTYTLASNAH